MQCQLPLRAIGVHAVAPFTKADAEVSTERDIVVTVTANGAPIGGMICRSIPGAICRLTIAPKLTRRT
jgi:hypothetical protein